MRRLLAAAVALAACGAGAAPPPRGANLASAAAPPARLRPAPEPLIAELMARLGPAAGCPASRRVWCVAAAGWDAGTAADLPPEGVLPGLSIALERDRSDAELLETEVGFAALAVQVGRGLITDIPPESAGEQRALGAAITRVAAAARSGGAVELPRALVLYLLTLPAAARYPLARTPAGWRLSGKAEAWLRRLPSGAWVAVEVPPDGPIGIFVTIFAPGWLEAPR